MQTELEKTQLEIARLQLEQERHKLAQMQRRQGVVDGLGQGAVAVGGATVKGVGWVVSVALGGVAGAFVALAFMGWVLMNAGVIGHCGRQYPGASVLYQVGCAYGTYHALTVVVALGGAAVGAYFVGRGLRA